MPENTDAAAWHFQREMLDRQAAEDRARLDDIEPEYQAQAWHWMNQQRQNREAAFRASHSGSEQ